MTQWRWRGESTYTGAAENTATPQHAQNANPPLNNTHILGGCRYAAKPRTKRHNDTFLLLHPLLQESNGGRWPVIGVDMGSAPVTDFRKHTPKTEDTIPFHLPPIPQPDLEGLQDDKQTSKETQHTIPD